MVKIKDPKETCKVGQGSECCAYVSVGADGFECLKGTGVQAMIDARLQDGSMNAKGTGNWPECLNP